jgi:hypothetical protein
MPTILPSQSSCITDDQKAWLALTNQKVESGGSVLHTDLCV